MRVKIKWIISLSFWLLSAGCAIYYGPLYDLPKVSEHESGEIVVIREEAFRYKGVGAIINLDGIDIFSLAGGEYIGFQIKSGDHIISSELSRMSSLGPLASQKTKDSTLSFNLSPGEKVYILLVPARGLFSAFSFAAKRLEEKEAQDWIGKSVKAKNF